MPMIDGARGASPRKVSPTKYKYTPPAPKPYKAPVTKYKPGYKSKSVVPVTTGYKSKTAVRQPLAKNKAAYVPKSVYSTAPVSSGGGSGSGGGGYRAATRGASYSGGSATGYSPSGPVGGSSSAGISTPTGPAGVAAPAPITVGSATPSEVAALALASKPGGGSAGSFARRRNRAGAGFNLSLTPEQLRNIAARRMGS